MDPLLEVRDLTTRFYTLDGVVHAVNGISYTLSEGETLGIVGESGCGKSVSVLSVMALIPEPPGKIAAGEVLYRGQDLLKLDETEIQHIRGNEIAMVFQDPMTSLNPVLTIGRQISEALIVHLGMDREQARQRTVELLDVVGIPQAADRYRDYPHQFSGGMRQRVMIAMALACAPSIFIADEPTTALDVTIQAQVLRLIKDMQAEFGLSLILITHDLAVVAHMVDHVYVMYLGRVVEEGPVEVIFDEPRHPYTRALLRSIPRLTAEKRKLEPIEGSVPDPYTLPPGCAFHPRCRQRVGAICAAKVPAPTRVGPDHCASCFLYDDAESDDDADDAG